MTRELVVRCNNYAGPQSDERCRTLEQYVRSHLTPVCTLKKVKMVENEIQSDLITPELILQYSGIDDGKLLDELDNILIGIGISAIKAVVSNVVSRAAQGALGGGVLGLLAGSNSSNNTTLGAALIGGLIGGIIGQSIQKSVPLLVAYKESGQWISEEITQKAIKRDENIATG